VTVQVLIQAHPARAELAEGLLDCLGAGEIIYDPDPGAPPSPWRTYEACVRRGLELGTDSILVIQEDVLVCGRFLEGVELALAARPDNPVAFFVPGKLPAYINAIYRVRRDGGVWAELPTGSWCPVVATAWPRALAEGLLEWAATNRPPAWRADDEIAGRFLYYVNTPVMATVPSLVEHPDTEPSVMNGHKRVGDGRDPGRRAYYFIGDEPGFGCDATVIDWTR
jgi:hypothetical protein